MNINRREFLKGTFVLAGSIFVPAGLVSCRSGNPVNSYDLVVYGGTSAGIIAAVQASRIGLSVVVVEPSHHLGGLTTGGLGRTDVGRADAIGGMSMEFYRRIRRYYDHDDKWIYEPKRVPEGEAMFDFEPHVAMKVYQEMLEEASVPVVKGERLILSKRGVEKKGNRIEGIVAESGNIYHGGIYIDATYEGDLMAMAGVSYHVGREANSKYDETLNGIQKVRTHNHVFPGFVDPYVVPGNRSSGILPGVHNEDVGRDGEGDHRVQAYCFRMCLTDARENRVAFEKPQGYEEIEYELLFRNFEAGENRVPWLPGMMPNRKTDTNNRWGFSTNKIGINYEYPDGDYAKRASIIEEQEHYQKGLMWTLANHPRVPADIREEVGKWGLTRDEFTDKNGWPTQIYVREARRMVGEYMMTEHDCRRTRIANDPVGMGSYQMDSHNVQRYITSQGCVQNEGNIEVSPRGPYAISYRSILPKRTECSNLLVCCAVSSSHISYGSIRMEPVFMVLGQSAAIAAAQSIRNGIDLHDIDYSELKVQLEKNGQRLNVNTEIHPPFPADKEAPKQRNIHGSEPQPENSCIVVPEII
jgi:hypothetical protein